MRTKTLLLSAAAIAAGLLPSFASSSNVYSVNIVGYVNKTTAIGFNSAANPLIPNGGNSATNVLANAGGQWDGSTLYVWTGLKFAIYFLDSTSPTGYTDSNFNPVAAPDLAPGTGFLFNNQVAPGPVTFVGQVTGVVTNDPQLIAVLNIPAAPTLQMLASPIPVGGGISSVLQLTNPGGAMDGNGIQLPVIVGGNLTSWTLAYFDSTSGTGFADSNFNPVAEPVIPVGSAFLFVNNNASPVVWNQVINLGN